MVFHLLGIIIAKSCDYNTTLILMLYNDYHKIAPKEIISALFSLYNQGKFDDVLSWCSKLIGEFPYTFEFYNLKGAIYFEKGNKEVALHQFRENTKLFPEHPYAYNNLATALIKAGKYEEARYNFEVAIKLKPDYAEAYNNLGNLHKDLGEYNSAIFVYKKALNLNPSYYEAYNNLGVVLGKNRQYNESEKFLNYSKKLNPNFEEAYKNLGILYNVLGKFDEAKTELQKAVNINKKNFICYNELGNVYLNEFNFINSKYYFKKAIEIFPEFAEAYNNLGRVFIKTGDISKAFKYLKKSNFIDKNFKYVCTNFDIIHFLTLNYKNYPCSYFLPRYFGEISKKEILKFINFQKINLKKINYKNHFEKIYKDLLGKKVNYKDNKNNNFPVILLGFGRSGSLFLHSLLDSHPQISTLPGYFFKGWFNEKTWPIFKPDYKELKWREILVKKICNYFEPQFNANCKKNVIGKPNGEIKWLAKNLGFTQLGDNSSEVLKLDQEKFKEKFIKLLSAFDNIDLRICFELIHKAFDKAYRSSEIFSKDKIIFYHLHNPSYFEHANFNYHYPNNKSLYIVRHPIQMLESWINIDISHIPFLHKNNHSFYGTDHYMRILDGVTKITECLEYFINPLISMGQVKGVKLEDLKKNTKQTIEKITKWIGIENDPVLYESTFMGKKFSRPSPNFDNIQGFDTKSIDAPLGRVFGEKDIEIIEILFWPFMDLYGYTKISKEKFLKKIKQIRPLLDQPFQFEVELYNKLPTDKPDISKIGQFNDLHRRIIRIWDILNEYKTYPYLIKPLIEK